MSQNPTRLRVVRRQTVNMGDYNSISFEVSIEEDLPPDQKKSEKLDELWKQSKLYMEKKFLEEGLA